MLIYRAALVEMLGCLRNFDRVFAFLTGNLDEM